MKTNRIKQLRFFILCLIAILAPEVMWAQTCSHEYNETTDPHHTVCTKCNHSFLRYTTQNDVVVNFAYATNQWKDAQDNDVTLLYNTNTNGEGIIEFGSPIVNIPKYLFSSIKVLTSVIIPVSVKSIEHYAFNRCSNLTTVVLPNSLKEIYNNAFDNCFALSSIDISNSVTSIGVQAFEGCSSLTSINIPTSLSNIKPLTFHGCSGLTSVTIPGSVQGIGDSAFGGCSQLSSVTIGNSVMSIGTAAFFDCNRLSSVTIGNSVMSIGTRAFAYCTSLKSITLPSSVKSIGDNSFDKSGIMTITNKGATPPIVSGVLYKKYFDENGHEQNDYTALTLNVPSAGYFAYREADEWKRFGTIQCIQCNVLTKTEPNEPTCIANGNKEYWTCVCGKVYKDAEGNQPTNITECIIKSKGHNTDLTTGICVRCNIDLKVKTSYRVPVYNTAGDASSGIASWSTVSDVTAIPLPSSSALQTWYNKTYVVQSGKTVTLSNGAVCNGAVNLILEDGAILNITGSFSKAGISVTGESTSLTIYGQSNNTGILTTEGGSYAAGIGGDSKADGYNISINGGNITANGGIYGAGIGGGFMRYGYNILINGGNVIAKGNNNAAAIGNAAIATGNLVEGKYGYIKFGERMGIIANSAVIDNTMDDMFDVIKKMSSISVHEHSGFQADNITKCNEYGTKSTVCSICQKTVSIVDLNNPPIGHHGNDGYTPTYEWGGTHNAATCLFTLKCNMCSNNVVTSQPLTASKVSASHVNPACTTVGNETWSAPAGNYNNGEDVAYTGTAQTKNYVIPALGHTMTKTEAKPACTETGNQAYWTCSVCNKVYADADGNTETTVEASLLPIVGHSYVNGICDACNDQFVTITASSFVDGVAYKRTIAGTVGTLTYQRSVTDAQVNNWQALYVPFSMSYEDWKDKYDVATIQNFHEYADADGVVQKTVLEARYVKSGTLKENHPYLIRPKTTGTDNVVTLTLTGVNLVPAANTSNSCQSVERKYTFTGTYSPVQNLKTNNCLFMTDGSLKKTESDAATLKAQRWYLKIDNLDGQVENVSSPSNAKVINISVIGEDDATGIEDIQVISTPLVGNAGAAGIYDLQGRRQQNLHKGVNIIRQTDGTVKKVMVK